MNQEYAKYLRFGKMVMNHLTAEQYRLIASANSKDNTVDAVRVENISRFDLLTAWIGNWERNSMGFRQRWDGDIEQCKRELESYVVTLNLSDIEPSNKIRFITPNYDTLFEVTDLKTVKVNGEVRRVYYLDDCHFGFVGGAVYHICEFAELCKRNGIKVEQMQ